VGGAHAGEIERRITVVRIARARATTSYGRLAARGRDVRRQYVRRRPFKQFSARVGARRLAAARRGTAGAWSWPEIADWLAGFATLAAMASWGLVASLVAG
jgi:hypothetical protein